MLGASVYSDIERYFSSCRTHECECQNSGKIDALNEDTRKLLSEQDRLKEIEGLRVYNRQLEKQIANQEREMAQLSSSIDEDCH